MSTETLISKKKGKKLLFLLLKPTLLVKLDGVVEGSFQNRLRLTNAAFQQFCCIVQDVPCVGVLAIWNFVADELYDLQLLLRSQPQVLAQFVECFTASGQGLGVVQKRCVGLTSFSFTHARSTLEQTQ